MSDEESACPVGDCGGTVRRYVGTAGGYAWGCDGPERHGDASIMNTWEASFDGSRAEIDFQLSEKERRTDPVAWVIQCLIDAREPQEKHFSRVDTRSVDTIEQFPTGFTNGSNTLPSLGGMVTLSGKASAGKSWFALGIGLTAGEEGWDTHYVAAEGVQTIKQRLQASSRSQKNFEVHQVDPGFNLNETLDEITTWIKAPKTLLIFDSISTMQALMASSNAKDKWETQSKLEMFLMQVRSLTRGYVAIVNLSEMNAAGEAKGRSLDHRSDIGIKFVSSDEDHSVKEVTVTKNWNGPTGPLGYGRVDSWGLGMNISNVPPGESIPEPEETPVVSLAKRSNVPEPDEPDWIRNNN